MRSSWIATSLLMALGAGTAHAADNGFYLGGGFVQSNIDEFASDQFDFDDTGWKIIAGFRPLDAFAVEAEYMDLGSESVSVPGLGTANADVSTIAAFGVLLLPLAPIDLFAKAGLAQWKVDGGISSTLGDIDFDDDGTEFAYGAGIQARFGSLGIRGEYEAFDVEDSDGVELFSLSLTWTFL
jgi:hypothetical protein